MARCRADNAPPEHPSAVHDLLVRRTVRRRVGHDRPHRAVHRVGLDRQVHRAVRVPVAVRVAVAARQAHGRALRVSEGANVPRRSTRKGGAA
jgi:hypothetical protein